jgi:MFS family permease
MPRIPSTVFWRYPDLLKILIGETVSDFGSEVGDLALPLLASITLEASAGQMASLFGAEYVPRILIGLASAGWIDRVRRRPVLITTNLARCAILTTVALAAWRNALTVELLYPVAIGLAALDVVFTTTFAAYLPSLVPTTTLVAANGARATSSAGASVVGPAVAGVLISALGAPVAILADALSFLASVTGLTLVHTTESAPYRQTGHAHPVQEIVEGWRALLHDRVLRALAATAFTANFFYRVIMAVYVLYLTRDLHLSAAMVGAIFGLGGGLGVLTGSALAAPVARAFGVGRSMIAAHVLFGILGLPLALSASLPGLAALLVFASEFLQLTVNAVYMVNRTSVEQALSPPELRGRIQSSRTVAHAIAGILGLVAGGLLGERVNASAAIIVGVIGGLTSFVWLVPTPLRGLCQLSAP